MQPRQQAWLPGLDTLRATAILLVMMFHLSWLVPESIGKVAHFGWMGVDLFFVLSGYLIGSQLLRAHALDAGTGLWRFYRGRLFRILPAYLVVVALYFTVPSWREAPGISPLWQFGTFTENLFVDYTNNHAFSHVWSLCIEEQFYLLLPLIVLYMMKSPSMRRTIALLSLFVSIGIATRTYVFFHILRPLGPDDAGVKYIEQIYYPTWTRMDGLLAGVTLALIQIFRPAWWSRITDRTHTTLLTGVVLFGISLWLFNDRFTSHTGAAEWGTFIGFPILSTGLAMIVASSLSDNGILHRFPIPGASFIAALAYSLYLTHKEMAHLAQLCFPTLITDDPTWTSRALTSASCLAGAAALHVSVERPFMRLRDLVDRRRVLPLDADPKASPHPPSNYSVQKSSNPSDPSTAN